VVRSPVGAGLLLLAIYVGLSFLNSPQGFLGTDTGGKVATLKYMADHHDRVPEVGYWAARWDPTARVHGLYYTLELGGHFVNVTSLPMIVAAEPLWRLGGYRLVLLFPMLGAVAAAYAARALARRISKSDGWAAFWIVGLASPLAIYALDFWEHTIGVALMAWGVIALLDALERRPVWWRGALAGLAFGVAFSMRTEAAVYAFTSVGLVCAVMAFGRRQLGRAVVTGAGAVVTFGLAVLANSALEDNLLGATLRSARATGAASGGGSDLALRAKEAVITGLSPFPSSDTGSFVLAAALAIALGYIVLASGDRKRHTMAVVMASLVGVVYLVRLVSGLGFVPGLVATTPIAVAGLVLGWRRTPARLVVALAVVPLPLVFLFQFAGGAAPQWGGRYILTSGFLLLVVGVTRLRRLEPWIRNGLVGLSVAVTVFGLLWLSVRSHQVADAAKRVQALPASVLISPNGFIPREFGATYGDKDWLASGSDADLRFAVDVVRRSGRPSFAIVDLDPGHPPNFPGFHVVSRQTMPFLSGTDFHVTTYERSG
jgi:hypothetical protein